MSSLPGGAGGGAASAPGRRPTSRCGLCVHSNGWCCHCQRKRPRTAEEQATLDSPQRWQQAVRDLLIEQALANGGGMPEEAAVLLAMRERGLEQPWPIALDGFRARMAASQRTYRAWTLHAFPYEAAAVDRGPRPGFAVGERVELAGRRGGGFGTVLQCRRGEGGGAPRFLVQPRPLRAGRVPG